MLKKSEPWYLHAILVVIILILTYVLIQVAIVEPREVIKTRKYHKLESRLRMTNLREAQILWEKKFGSFTDNLDSLVNFIKFDTTVAQVMVGTDTITGKPTNPFHTLSHGKFDPDSLFLSPRSYQRFMVMVDTSIEVDTFINRRGEITKIDSNIIIGTRYEIKSPDSDDKIGDVFIDALRNTASWE